MATAHCAESREKAVMPGTSSHEANSQQNGHCGDPDQRIDQQGDKPAANAGQGHLEWPPAPVYQC